MLNMRLLELVKCTSFDVPLYSFKKFLLSLISKKKVIIEKKKGKYRNKKKTPKTPVIALPRYNLYLYFGGYLSSCAFP